MVLTQQQTKDIKGLIQESCNSDWITTLTTKIKETILQEFNQQLQRLEAKIESLEKEVKSEKEKNHSLCENNMYLVDCLEQYGRRSNLRLYGVPETRQEDTENKVLQIFNEEMGLQITSDHIERCHRVGKLNKKKPRSIIVKFLSYKQRKQVFQNKKKLKGQKITIKEDLTASRQALLHKVYEFINFKSVWSVDGTIFIKLNDKILSVQNEQDLQKLVLTYKLDPITV